MNNLFDYHNQNLQLLRFKIRNLTDQFVKGFINCENLRELYLGKIDLYNLSDIGEDYFSQLKNVETLQINNIQVDNILVALSKLRTLKNIDISYCRFTYTGITSLCLIPNLVSCNLSGTNVLDTQLIKLIEHSLLLKEIFIKFCPNVTNVALIKACEIKENRNHKHILKLYCDIELANLNCNTSLVRAVL